MKDYLPRRLSKNYLTLTYLVALIVAAIRNLFKKIDKNRVFNYGIRIGATALVQSSSASSIMTVGLAHANIVTVKQGSGFILGAKVGTTLTAFIFALSGMSKGGFSISSVFAAVAFVGDTWNSLYRYHTVIYSSN